MKKKIIAAAVFSLVALVLAGCSKYNYGDQNQNQNQNQEQNQNQNQENVSKGNSPAEMSSVCDGKSEGDSCEIAMPQGKDGSSGSDKVIGTCKKSPQGDQLACMPDNMPSGGNMPGQGGSGGPKNK
jgi:hypothetical protein